MRACIHFCWPSVKQQRLEVSFPRWIYPKPWPCCARATSMPRPFSRCERGWCGKHAVSRGSVMEDGLFGTPGTQNWLVPKINTSWYCLDGKLPRWNYWRWDWEQISQTCWIFVRISPPRKSQGITWIMHFLFTWDAWVLMRIWSFWSWYWWCASYLTDLDPRLEAGYNW